MHLQQIDIANLRAISSLTLPFTERTGGVRPVTVLAGPNGCGKTSILYGIVQSLRGVMGYRTKEIPKFGDDDIHRAKGSGQHPVYASVKLHVHFGSTEMDAIRHVLDKSGKKAPPELPDGNLSVTWQYPQRLRSDGTRAADWFLQCDKPWERRLWLEGAKYAWSAWKERKLSNPSDAFQVGMLRFFAQSRDPQYSASDNGLEADHAIVSSTSAPTTASSSVRRAQISVKESLRRLGEFAHGEGLPADDKRRQWENELKDRFNRICEPKKYKGYWYDHRWFGETPLLEDQGREYPFRNAASGEQVILQYLTQFTFPLPVNNSLILIDEPELHLHPSWARQLYRALPRLGVNNQFILTTHSAELRQLAAEENALIDLGQLDSELTEAGAHAQ